MLQLSHEAPSVKAATGALGTYTVTPGSGSVPFGAYTMPLTLVVPPPGQLCCWRQRLTHGGSEQTFGVTEPQVWPEGQLPQLRMLPQPSPAAPQS